jgi:hypothetical protein
MGVKPKASCYGIHSPETSGKNPVDSPQSLKPVHKIQDKLYRL